MDYGENLDRFQTNKRVFLEDNNYSENSKIKYWNVLGKDNSLIHIEEVLYNKDLYNFNKKEIERLVKNLATSRRIVQEQYLTVISRYIDWCIDRGFLTTGINPCHRIDYWEDIGNKNKLLESTYQTLDEFYKWLRELKCSDVDKFLLVMLRYGIKIRDTKSIRHNQIDKSNKVIIINKKGKILKFPIDDRFLEWYNKCMNCTEYEFVKYVEGEFVIKNTTRGSIGMVNDNSLRNRLQIVSSTNNINRIPVSILNRNRYYDLLYNIHETLGEVNYNDIREVIKTINGSSSGNQVSLLKKDWEIISGTKVKM